MDTARVWVADVGGEEFKGWEEARAGNGDELGRPRGGEGDELVHGPVTLSQSIA